MTEISARLQARSSSLISVQNCSNPWFSSLIGAPVMDVEVSSSSAQAIRGSGLLSST